jgi:hypothetical protein
VGIGSRGLVPDQPAPGAVTDRVHKAIELLPIDSATLSDGPGPEERADPPLCALAFTFCAPSRAAPNGVICVRRQL